MNGGDRVTEGRSAVAMCLEPTDNGRGPRASYSVASRNAFGHGSADR